MLFRLSGLGLNPKPPTAAKTHKPAKHLQAPSGLGVKQVGQVVVGQGIAWILGLFESLGFRVWGLGFRVSGLGSRGSTRGLGFVYPLNSNSGLLCHGTSKVGSGISCMRSDFPLLKLRV